MADNVAINCYRAPGIRVDMIVFLVLKDIPCQVCYDSPT